MKLQSTKEKEFAQQLLDFLYNCPSPFHVTETVKTILLQNGFQELKASDKWTITKSGKYFTTRNNTTIIAFKTGSGELVENGFNIVAAHTDSPALRIKPNPEMNVEGKYLKLNTETYGGPILSTWFDRPLSMAGRVSLASDNIKFPETRFVNFDRPILYIPNVAYHFNRAVNEGVEFNKQRHMQPLLSMVNGYFEQHGFVQKLIADELGVDASKIIDFELNVYEYAKGEMVGLNEEFISSGRIDNLAMVHAGLEALLQCDNPKTTAVLACFDNEEIGSNTKQGADSPLLRNVLERITLQLSAESEAFYRAISKSFMVSADMAHAVHPNYAEMHDPVNRPYINGGPVIKINANQKYTTDCDTNTVFELLCRKAEVPYQKFVNRSDLAGGSTLGSIVTSQLDIRSVDIGNPMLAMHSLREFAGVTDHLYVTKVFKEFFTI